MDIDRVTPAEADSDVSGPRAGASDGWDLPLDAAEAASDDHGFSPAFYLGFYTDLRAMTLAEAEIHWHKLGMREGRFGCARHVLEDFATRGVSVPEDFDPGMYLRLNPALRSRLGTDRDAAAHYLGVGRGAGLRYAPEDPAFFRALYEDARSEYSRRLREEMRHGTVTPDQSATALFARIGMESIEFLQLFDISDYIALNPGVGLSNLPQCLHHFAEQGLRELAPIALDHIFDAAFYRSTNRESDGFSDHAAYRHWLTIGLPRGESPNAAQFLLKLGLLETGAYPSCFNAGIYAAANPDLEGLIAGPWRLLQHCILNGIVEGRPGCQLSRATADIFRAAADRQAVAGKLDAAKHIYQKALAVAPEHVLAMRHYADCLLRLGEWFNAASVYEETIRCRSGTIWSHLNLATCYINLRRWQEAAAALLTVQQRQSGDIGIRNRLREICCSGFEAGKAEALWLAEQGFDQQARDCMRNAVALLSMPSATVPMTVAKAERAVRSIAIIADMGLMQCRFYRVEQKLAQLATLGMETTLFDMGEPLDRFHQLLPSLDAVIFYRVPATPEIVDAILAARRAEIPTLYEIDDLMFEAAYFPADFASYGGQISRGLYATLVIGAEALKGAMALCDYAIASTPPLAAQMAPLVRSGRAFVHRNALHAPHDRAMAAHAMPSGNGCVQLFYGTGTKAHNEDFETHLAPALAPILAEHPEVRLVILGYLRLPPSLSPFADQIMLIEPVWQIDAYWRVLGGMDINLAVLTPGAVADCKSEIKWLEAAMLGIPSIVTPTETYGDVVVDGATGVFATTPDEWYRALKRLVASGAERRRIGAAARKAALAAYGIRAMAKNLRHIFKAIAVAPPAKRARKRLLLVNVYFPPQAVGGATRVVADNAIDLHRLYGDEFEIEVFTGIEGSPTPYRLSTQVWKGIRVNGVTTPDDPSIDSRVFDQRMGEAFAACVDRFSPDIIHFHCIQRLTLAVCAVARARRIPYYVTLHDGWWISDQQFLVDRCGALDLYDYTQPLAQLAEHGSARFSRMNQCAEILADAAQVLAVSRPFAALHERCGIKNLRVIENGLPSVMLGARSRSPQGKVRLAHIGGVSLHKGYNLFKAAVMLSSFRNLDILVVDHALQPGIEHRASWGATPVRFRGKLPQAEIADLYRDIDVLIAPSVWPESYGLVVREALQAGCWVVTSDRGALSEDVTPGCGHVVPVEGYAALQAVLAQIDADPARYLGPTESRPVLRGSADQARELAALYLGSTAPAGKVEPPSTASAVRTRLPRLAAAASA